MTAVALKVLCFLCFVACIFAGRRRHQDDLLSLWNEKYYGDPTKDGRDSQEAREKSSSRRKNRLDTPAAQFGIKVEDLTESRLNATIVLTASQKFDKKVLRYVVIYWPERRPNAWNERFGGVDEDKNHVLIDELRPGTPYFVRSTALLGDGTHEQVEANFSTPGLPSHDQLQTNVSTQALGHPLMIRPPTGLQNPSSQTCLMSITKRRMVNGSLHLKWTQQTCSGAKIERFAIIYSSTHDYRRVYAKSSQRRIVIRGLIEEPSDVRVEALPLEVPTGTDNPVEPFAFVPINTKKRPGDISGNGPTTSGDRVTTTTTSTVGLLISVVILSILFLSSAIVAVYLCVYLRMHRHEMVQKRPPPESKMTEMVRIMKTGNETGNIGTSEKGVVSEESVPSDSSSVENIPLDDPLRMTSL